MLPGGRVGEGAMRRVGGGMRAREARMDGRRVLSGRRQRSSKARAATGAAAAFQCERKETAVPITHHKHKERDERNNIEPKQRSSL